jgi:hypothetical protein
MKKINTFKRGLAEVCQLFVLTFVVVSFFSPFLIGKEKNEVWTPAEVIPGQDEHPPELIKLAEEFRAMRGRYGRRWHPGWTEGILDYNALVNRQKELLPKFRARLDSLEIKDWSVHNKIDYLLLRSEMNQLEWELYVIRQWSRNPGFYVSLAQDNVRRHLTGGRVMGQNPKLMPYSEEQAEVILRALDDTDKILDQGRKNLTEIVPELADVVLKQPSTGWPLPNMEKGQLKYIVDHYRKWAEETAQHFPQTQRKKLVPAAVKAAQRLLEFGKWLEQNSDKMTGKYYIGKPLVDWYLRNVYFMPYNSDQIKLMAEMERARALAYLQFELHKNRHLPPIKPAKTTKKYLAWDNETVLKLRRWYLENGENLLTDQDYQPLIRSEESIYLPPFGMLAFPYKAKPGVSRVLVPPAYHWSAKNSFYGWYTDPGVLQGHEYWPGHTYQGILTRHNPCPIRRNHSDSAHSEGWAFYNEEILVALDFPFVRGSRARELIYINMLQRAERILIGLPLLAGEITPEEAYHNFLNHVPAIGSGLGIPKEEAYMEAYKRVIWRGNDCFDALVGKLQLLKLLADCKMKLKKKFDLREFHDQYLMYGRVPISLLRWEILGDDSEADMFWEPVRLSHVLKK